MLRISATVLPTGQALYTDGSHPSKVAGFSIPTAPTNHLPDWLGLKKIARGQKGANKAIDPVLVR